MNRKQLEDELTWAADEFLLEEFALELDIPIRISGRMTKTLGSFYFKRSRRKNERGEAAEIVLSKNLVEYHPWEAVMDTLKHECVHYALFELGEPFDDGHPHFEQTLARLGVSSSQTKHFRGVIHVYKCEQCGTTYKRHMKGFEKRYGCGECLGRLQNAGTVTI